MDADATATLHKMGVAATDDISKFTWFEDHESVIKAIYTGTEFLESAAAGDEVGIILETTSFYTEKGGQIFDTGSLEGSCGSFQVSNVQIYGGFVLHIGSVTGEIGRFSVGDKVICKVDYDRRKLIAPNHTYTHMLNFAMREVLGNHVDQKGSIVLPEKLRFDFSHGTHISNTREAKAFALLSEEGIAKGIRRITAVTTDSAFKAMELAFSLEQEIDAASEAEGSLLEKKVASLRSRVDAAPIPAPKKADLRTKISLL
ncbi:hypothetical protein VitviT2T_024032 [Vitis vinifera]|uniref:Alanyl-transfer RNA synthetases family profile domain-containing protein n=1 Tax=Vitis vinifera TaxID=29760 RepID=A0ABY9DEH4_VITVI|nr:hypothetical protein VitviT2T_024032 [Vitis vinifera]